jgi:hypothetical protein
MRYENFYEKATQATLFARAILADKRSVKAIAIPLHRLHSYTNADVMRISGLYRGYTIPIRVHWFRETGSLGERAQEGRDFPFVIYRLRSLWDRARSLERRKRQRAQDKVCLVTLHVP